MPGFMHHFRRASRKARWIFGTVVIVNSTCIIWVNYDQKAQFKRMHAGVELDEKRLEKKLLDFGIDQSALYKEQLDYYDRTKQYPQHALAKNHKPIPPENIPELAQLGVTRESTYVPGMDRPDVDVDKF
eukprot:263094_1